MTRVLFLTESFHPVLGGGERHVRDLATRLAASGMEATVVTRCGDPAWPREERLDGVRVLRVPPSGPGRRGKYLMVPAALAALRRECRQQDLLVVRGTRVLGLPGLLAARWLGRAVVLQPEVNGELSGEVYTWGTRVERGRVAAAIRSGARWRNRLLADADAFVAMSRQIEREMLDAGLRRKKVVYIPHGVDTERFRPVPPAQRESLRQCLGLPQGARIAVYTGRLLRGKGLETLVEAFSAVAREDPQVHLVLVGSGQGQSLSIEHELSERIPQAGLAGRATLTGRVENVEHYLQAADVFVFPSVFEALGISLIEAAACGLPCVGARTGGIVDVIEHERSGLLFGPGDSSALAACLRTTLGDGGLRRAMGSRARALAQARFDVVDSLDRYRALFQELAGAGARLR